MACPEAGLSLEDLLLYPPSQQLYVLDHQVPDGDGAVEALCAVLLKRDHGFLLGVPRGLLADSEISAGFVAPMEAPLGPSTVVECPAAILQGGALTSAPGRVVSMTLLDVSAELAQRLVPFEAEEPYELLVSFDPASPDLVPEPAAALSLALTWIQDPSVEALDRVTFYSADEAPQAVPAKKPRPRLHLSRADMAAQATPPGTSAAEPVQKPKKPSVAGLAVQMETLMGILPGLSARIDGMDQRTQEIVNLVSSGAAAPLRRPLSDGLGATAKTQPPALALLGPRLQPVLHRAPSDRCRRRGPRSCRPRAGPHAFGHHGPGDASPVPGPDQPRAAIGFGPCRPRVGRRRCWLSRCARSLPTSKDAGGARNGPGHVLQGGASEPCASHGPVPDHPRQTIASISATPTERSCDLGRAPWSEAGKGSWGVLLTK